MVQTQDWSNEVVVRAEGVTLLAKLCFEKGARLAELEDCSIACVREKMRAFYGAAAAEGDLVYNLNPDDADELQLLDDGDVRLAKKVASEPVKITSKRAAPPPPAYDGAAEDAEVPVASPVPADDGRSAYDHASAALGHFGLDAPAAQIALLLKALELRPRRLVKCGLAPPHSLKRTADGDDDAPVAGAQLAAELVAGEEKDDDAFEMVDGLSLDDKDDDKDDKDDDDDDDKDDKDDTRPPAGPDAVVAALAARGVTLLPSTLHALLRLLDVHPRRFAKLGLVGDIKDARAAYKAGGGEAARSLFKRGKGGCPKGWGRGLHGRGPHGRGRGAGWAFGDEGCRKKRRAWKGASSGSWGDATNGGHWNSTWGGPTGSHSWGASTSNGKTTPWGTPPPGVPHEPLNADAAPGPPPPPHVLAMAGNWGPPPPFHPPPHHHRGAGAGAWGGPPPPPHWGGGWGRGGGWGKGGGGHDEDWRRGARRG